MEDRFKLKGTTFVKRLESAVNIKEGGVWSRLAKSSGIPQSTIQKIREGSSPTLRTLNRICGSLHIPIEWLVDGRNNPDEDRKPAIPNDKVSIPISYDIKASAGLGLENLDESWDNMIVPNQFLSSVIHVEFSQDLRIIGVSGYSMNPTYKDGDLVLIDVSVKEFIGSGTYIFKKNEHDIYIKNLKQMMNGSIKIISTSDNYENQTIGSKDEIQLEILAKVICAWNFQPEEH